MKYSLHESFNSFTKSVQQFGHSLKETVTQTTDKVSTAIVQAKDSLEHSLKTAENIQKTTSTAIETVITNSVEDFLAQHPISLHLLQIMGWSINHPIISLVILLFIIALLWSIIKGIVRLIETVSWSILKIPFQLIKSGFLFLIKLGNFAIHKIINNKNSPFISTITPISAITNYPTKQQRLAEISIRLEAIQKEQQQLLQEAANLITTETTDIQLNKIIINSNVQETSV
ncbi:hypothetical protein VB711_01135 [Cronbergia sp. UHCC 0137]|uniref:hypothetical protein n=1 Tax=Cronbergia sp. UHCC 0137 TaxID=3110239 RepID=UPI002B1FB1DA|nr:hypothetical protein [Cronbergia sp. UHCC 0137]MEA5616448.1 hypothetical protein [Cronbergia sp. UHCC 0137]